MRNSFSYEIGTQTAEINFAPCLNPMAIEDKSNIDKTDNYQYFA
jgi:hypothetical protein